MLEIGLELHSAREIDIRIIVLYQGLGRRLLRSPQDRIRSQHALCVFWFMLSLYVCDFVCKLLELYTW